MSVSIYTASKQTRKISSPDNGPGLHIQHLSTLKGNQAEEILILARKYGVVSPGTSLLMTLHLEGSGNDFMVGEVAIQGGSQPSPQKNLSLLSMLQQIRKGISVNRITKKIGQPHEVKAAEMDSKAVVSIHCLPDFSELKIALGPELLWARPAMAGAEVERVA